MKKPLIYAYAGFTIVAFPLSLASQTILNGDYVIVPGSADGGSLTISGNLHVEGNDVDLGTTSDGNVALLVSYQEQAMTRQVVVYASREAVEYLWKDGSSDPVLASPKMSLGADNSLLLYDSDGIPTIHLLPETGEIRVLAGFRLPDGTLLQGAQSLRSTALYDAAGRIVMRVGDGAYSLGEYAVGDHSVALGGQTNLAFGKSNVVLGGMSNYASGYGSSIIGGEYNSNNGDKSAIIGGDSNASNGVASIVAGGSLNLADGDYSFIGGGAGNQTYADSSFIAGGSGNKTYGMLSFASGSSLIAKSYGSFVIGNGNVAQGDENIWVPTDDLFVIGNRPRTIPLSEKSNAFVVHKNGITRAAGVIESKEGIRVPPGGDIPMGVFTAGRNPADMNAGLRYGDG